jgi:uncharacterized membrane protein
VICRTHLVASRPISATGQGSGSTQVGEGRRSGFALTVALVISIVVGLIILSFDGLLWFDNPKNGHAYALIAFTFIQLLLLTGLFLRPRWTVRAAFYWSMIYLLLLLLNPLSGPAIGVSPAEFALYLFGLSPIGSFDNVSCPFLCPPFAVTYDLLIVCQIAIIIFARREMKR